MNYVSFPKLGLEFNINRVAFTVLGIPIYWYGVIIATGFMLAVILAMKHSKDYDIKQDNILDLVLYATPVAIIAARLFYVAFNWEAYSGNLIDIINTRKGGLAIYGGVIGAFTTAYVFTRIKKLNFLKIVDFAIIYFPLAQAIGRWGNFINQEAYGSHTQLPWGMNGNDIVNGPVHPTFIYESLWNIVAFFILLGFRKRKKRDGEVFFLYMILYGLGRWWIELLRTDSLMVGNLKVNFLIAILFVVVFSTVFIVRRMNMEEAEMQTASSYSKLVQHIREQNENKNNSNDEEISDKIDNSEDKTQPGIIDEESVEVSEKQTDADIEIDDES